MRFATIVIKAAVATLVKNYDITTKTLNGLKYRNSYFFVFKPRDISLFFQKIT